MNKDFYNNILSRRTIRKYKQTQVDCESLKLIAQAGLNAPSAMNQQAWEIAIVTNKEYLEQLNNAVKASLPEAALSRIMSRIHDGKFSFFYNAPALIIVALKDNAIFPQCDCGCAITNMYHAANSLGLGSCWINQLSGNISKDEKIRKILDNIGISNDTTVYGCLAVGYADTLPIEKEIKGKLIMC